MCLLCLFVANFFVVPYHVLYGVPSEEIALEPLCTFTIPLWVWSGEAMEVSMTASQVELEFVIGSTGSCRKYPASTRSCSLLFIGRVLINDTPHFAQVVL